jgi:hypothetical protein
VNWVNPPKGRLFAIVATKVPFLKADFTCLISRASSTGRCNII